MEHVEDGNSKSNRTAPIVGASFKGETLRANFHRKPDYYSDHEHVLIWFSKGVAWKIVSGDKYFDETTEAYEIAKKYELPIGSVKIEEGTIITIFGDQGTTISKGYAVVATHFKGKPFEGVTSFKSVLNEEKITKVSPAFARLKESFEIAKKIGLQDIEGFFQWNSAVPVNFIDIKIDNQPETAQTFLDALEALPSHLY